jgi:FkbM family methyltransferase
MKSLATVFRRVQTRSKYFLKKSELGLRHRIAGRCVWIDHGSIQLPFHADGDQQELHYQVHCRSWWNDEMRVLSPLVKPGAVVVDVGANLGFLTVLLSRLAGPQGHVYSFEPSPITYRKLREVIDNNGLTNVTTYNVGCGETPSVMKLHAAESSGNSSLRPALGLAQREDKTEDVQIVVLDDHLPLTLRRLNFLKIDTEGFEDAVLAGAVKTLQKFHPVVYIELSSEYLESSQRALGILKSANYRFDHEPVLEQCHFGQNFIAYPN